MWTSVHRPLRSTALHSLITGGVSEQGRPCFNHRESKSLTAFPSAEPVCLGGGNVLILCHIHPQIPMQPEKKQYKISDKWALYPLQSQLRMRDILNIRDTLTILNILIYLCTVRKNVQNLYLQGYNGLSLGQYPQGYTRCTLSHGYVSVPLQYVPFKGKYVPLLTKLYLIVLWYHNVPLKKVQICPFKGTAPVTSLLYLWMANLYSIQHIKKARMLFITFIKHSKPLHSHNFHRMNVLSSITLS